MLGEQSLTDKLFWNCLSYLMNLKEKRAVTQIVSDLGIDNKFLNTLVSFLHSVQYFMEIREENGIDVVVPAEKKPMINVEFNLLEWMQFQSYFPNICKIENFKVHGELHEKLSLLESKFKDHDLFSSLSVLQRSHKGKVELRSIVDIAESDLGESYDDFLISEIEKAISQNKIIEVELFNMNNLELYPHKIVHIDNHLSLVSEDKRDKTIVHFYLKDLKNLKVLEQTYKPNHSSIEIDDFISGLRSIGDTEIRLILKITNNEHLHKKPTYQHLGNHCLITNGEGDTIWAAYVEPNDSLKNWLIQMGTDVEILDPISFKKEFLVYCEDKLKKSA